MTLEEYAAQHSFNPERPYRVFPGGHDYPSKDECIDGWGFATIPNWSEVKKSLDLTCLTVAVGDCRLEVTPEYARVWCRNEIRVDQPTVALAMDDLRDNLDRPSTASKLQQRLNKILGTQP